MTSVIGRGWATVELERAEAEPRDRERVGAFEDAGRCSWLGARCRRSRVGALWIVVLEPETEGRLAAFLARHGEGWAVTWSMGHAEGPDLEPRPGPLGPETFPLGQAPSGPFRLVVTTATIGP